MPESFSRCVQIAGRSESVAGVIAFRIQFRFQIRSMGRTASSRGVSLFYSIVAIFCGAGLGALLRWFLSLTLNELLPDLPLGTLAANLIGGYAIGMAAVVFTMKAGLPP